VSTNTTELIDIPPTYWEFVREAVSTFSPNVRVDVRVGTLSHDDLQRFADEKLPLYDALYRRLAE